jgi:hypothetical protein
MFVSIDISNFYSSLVPTQGKYMMTGNQMLSQENSHFGRDAATNMTMLGLHSIVLVTLPSCDG